MAAVAPDPRPDRRAQIITEAEAVHRLLDVAYLESEIPFAIVVAAVALNYERMLQGLIVGAIEQFGAQGRAEALTMIETMNRGILEKTKTLALMTMPARDGTLN